MNDQEKARLGLAIGSAIAVSNRLSEYAAFDPCRVTPWLVLPRSVWNQWRHQLLNPMSRPRPPQAFFDTVMSLCRIEGDHWIWARHLRSDKQQPSLMWKGKCYRVRRELMREHGIEGDLDNRNCMILTTCGSPRCINPHHLKTMPASEYVKSINQENGRKISDGLNRFHAEQRKKLIDKEPAGDTMPAPAATAG